jgi:hypothetical protein
VEVSGGVAQLGSLGMFVMIMRRVLWNIYVWPITLLILLGIFFELYTLRIPAVVDAVLTIPALIALHMYIRDFKCLSASFWRLFAFGYFAWDVYFNLVIDFMRLGNARFLIVPVFSLPLYLALFRYAFRDWAARPANKRIGCSS